MRLVRDVIFWGVWGRVVDRAALLLFLWRGGGGERGVARVQKDFASKLTHTQTDPMASCSFGYMFY